MGDAMRVGGGELEVEDATGAASDEVEFLRADSECGSDGKNITCLLKSKGALVRYRGEGLRGRVGGESRLPVGTY
jgi:hypothetical protein